MKKVKMLKNLIDRIDDMKDRPRDAFAIGYNNGLDHAISLINEKIADIEKAER